MKDECSEDDGDVGCPICDIDFPPRKLLETLIQSLGRPNGPTLIILTWEDDQYVQAARSGDRFLLEFRDNCGEGSSIFGPGGHGLFLARRPSSPTNGGAQEWCTRRSAVRLRPMSDASTGSFPLSTPGTTSPQPSSVFALHFIEASRSGRFGQGLFRGNPHRGVRRHDIDRCLNQNRLNLSQGSR